MIHRWNVKSYLHFSANNKPNCQLLVYPTNRHDSMANQKNCTLSVITDKTVVWCCNWGHTYRVGQKSKLLYVLW